MNERAGWFNAEYPLPFEGLAPELEGVAYEEYRDVFMELLGAVSGRKDFSLSSDASPDVELTLFRDGRELFVNAVTLSAEERAAVRPGFNISVKTGAKPERIELLPEGRPVEFSYEGERRRSVRAS